MPEDEMVDILDLMVESIELIRERFLRIRVSDDDVLIRTDGDEIVGITILNAITR